ncbi:MAG: hypothetical protein KF861_17360, partial [Planctomycetaceae bacterium]|nr:hypothetical protein [Planctomycetaceae bacterium]
MDYTFPAHVTGGSQHVTAAACENSAPVAIPPNNVKVQRMYRSNQLLLSVWRESCRHIEIDEFVTTALELLKGHAPVSRCIVRRIDREHREIVTVATAPRDAGGSALEDRRHYDADELKQVSRWGRNG